MIPTLYKGNYTSLEPMVIMDANESLVLVLTDGLLISLTNAILNILSLHGHLKSQKKKFLLCIKWGSTHMGAAQMVSILMQSKIPPAAHLAGFIYGNLGLQKMERR